MPLHKEGLSIYENSLVAADPCSLLAFMRGINLQFSTEVLSNLIRGCTVLDHLHS